MNRVLLAARAMYEVNRIYLEACGNNSQPPWIEAPAVVKEICISVVKAVDEDPELTPKEVYEAFAEYAKGGKRWASTRADPYEDVPLQRRIADTLSINVIRGVLDANPE